MQLIRKISVHIQQHIFYFSWLVAQEINGGNESHTRGNLPVMWNFNLERCIDNRNFSVVHGLCHVIEEITDLAVDKESRLSDRKL